MTFNWRFAQRLGACGCERKCKRARGTCHFKSWWGGDNRFSCFTRRRKKVFIMWHSSRLAAISFSRLQKLTLSLHRYFFFFFFLLHHDSADSCYTHCLSESWTASDVIMWYCVCISHSCRCNNVFYYATLSECVFSVLLLALFKM